MKPWLRITSLLMALALLPGCWHGSGRLLGAIFATAVVTAAIVSSHPPPPPPPDAYVPPPRPGYTWQPGYWTIEGDRWLWVEGQWVPNYPGYAWRPTHWEADPWGRWRLVPGHWVVIARPPPPPGPPPGP